MALLNEPTVPRPNPFYMFEQRTLLDEWRPFIPWAYA